MPDTYELGQIIEVKTDRPITLSRLVEILRSTRVVFVGEVHTNPDHHRFQLEIIRRLYQKGIDIVVGMEMFPRESQVILDRWAKGALSQENFVKEVGWRRIWGYPFRLYRDILIFAKDHGIGVVGLNAPREVAKKVARSGLGSLTSAERSRIARDIRLDNQAHRQKIYQRFLEHPESVENFEYFYQAQRVWDETMAETLARLFQNALKPPQLVVVIAGTGHIKYGLGIPEAFSRRTGLSFVTLIPAPQEEVSDLVLSGAADYLRVSLPTPPYHHKPRLGVILNPGQMEKGRLQVEGVIKGSLAQKMGLAPGDIIKQVNGIEIKKARDIHDGLKKSKDRTHHTMIIEREGRRITIPFTLPFAP